ncbi:MAG: sigma-70 family RNA polymerase sigma factor [Rhodothermia bacterium]|nr:sigma-70 family RNA polymerase sigma factor [Rhodothermia bacterium]
MSRHEVTDLLAALQDGDTKAGHRLFDLVYSELHDVAHRQLAGERRNHTLNTTALVSEAYLKWGGRPPDVKWSGRRHFYAIVARAMRQILVDYARTRGREKRGGGLPLVTFVDNLFFDVSKADELVALDEALRMLQAISPRQAKIVEYRFFAGLSVRDTADVLEISVATANRDWTTARLWLKREIDSILHDDRATP